MCFFVLKEFKKKKSKNYLCSVGFEPTNLTSWGLNPMPLTTRPRTHSKYFITIMLTMFLMVKEKNKKKEEKQL